MSTKAFLYFDSTTGYQEIFQLLEKRLKRQGSIIIHSHLLDDYNEFEIETNAFKIVYELIQQHRITITFSDDSMIQKTVGIIESALGKNTKITRIEYDD